MSAKSGCLCLLLPTFFLSSCRVWGLVYGAAMALGLTCSCENVRQDSGLPTHVLSCRYEKTVVSHVELPSSMGCSSMNLAKAIGPPVATPRFK